MRLFYLYFSLCFLLFSCAQEISLTGGAVDKEGPKVLRATPENQSVFFEGNSISLMFNEFINVQNINKELIMSPAPPGKIQHKVNGKKLTLTWEGNLRPNTTYQIQFGNSVKDFTANNIANNLNFVFSTGAQLDSNQMEGQVKFANNNTPAQGVWVMLYADSLLHKVPNSKPLYLTKTDASGNYQLNYIAPGTYSVFALKDDNQDYVYNLDQEYFGFRDSLIILKDSTPNIDFKIARKLPEKLKIKNLSVLKNKLIAIAIDRPFKNELQLYWNDSVVKDWSYAGYDSIHWDNTDPDLFKDGNFIIIENQDKERDTLKIKKVKPDYGTPPYLTLHKLYEQNPKDTLRLKTNVKCSALDSSLAFILHEKDTLPVKWALSKDGYEVYIWNTKEGQENYQFIAFPGALSSFMGESNIDTLKVNFKTQSNSYFVHLNLMIEGLDFTKNHYLLELIDKDQTKTVKILQREMDAVMSFKNLAPGEYKIKIIEDRNRDGYYTPSVPTEGIQAEKVLYYPEKIEMKKAWDQELIWKIDW